MSDSIADMMEPVTGEPPTKPRSDLGIRTLSGIVMMAVAAGTIWLGDWPFAIFVAAVGLGVLWEWRNLALKLTQSWPGRALWLTSGLVYVAVPLITLIKLRQDDLKSAAFSILVVIAVDVGAYFAGRTFGGPKIAPRISPSKTWAGLFGGMVFAALVLNLAYDRSDGGDRTQLALLGAILAIIAQAGDFFESWMKRRAGVKDSGRLIPGHGGLFDRVDGLLAVIWFNFLWALVAGA